MSSVVRINILCRILNSLEGEVNLLEIIRQREIEAIPKEAEVNPKELLGVLKKHPKSGERCSDGVGDTAD